MFKQHSNRYTLRAHRAKSALLTQAELVEIRAAQRTFEGAYLRTALSQFSFALVVLKVFTHEFYPVGALFAGFGAAVLVAGLLRREAGNKAFFRGEGDEGGFRTSGNVVALVGGVSVAAYCGLLVLILRL